jgi:hypothetical protein
MRIFLFLRGEAASMSAAVTEGKRGARGTSIVDAVTVGVGGWVSPFEDLAASST